MDAVINDILNEASGVLSLVQDEISKIMSQDTSNITPASLWSALSITKIEWVMPLIFVTSLNACIYTRRYFGRPPMLFSIFFGFVGFAFAGHILTYSLILNKLPGVIKMNHIIVLYMIAWVLINKIPFDLIYKLCTFQPFKLLIAAIATLDKVTSSIRTSEAAARSYPNSIFLPMITYVMYRTGHSFMYAINQKLSGKHHLTELSRPTNLMLIAILNSIAYFRLEKDESVWLTVVLVDVCECILAQIIGPFNVVNIFGTDSTPPQKKKQQKSHTPQQNKAKNTKKSGQSYKNKQQSSQKKSDDKESGSNGDNKQSNLRKRKKKKKGKQQNANEN